MAKRSTTTTIEEEEDIAAGPDPMHVAIKAYLESGESPIEEEVGKYEYNIKAQQLDQRGRVLHGMAVQTNNLLTLWDEILDQLGPGRYNLYVNFRPLGDTGRFRLVAAKDITVDDPENPGAAERRTPIVQTSTLPEGMDFFKFFMTQQQQNQQMMQMMMQQNTQIIVAALSGQRGGGTREILEAIRVGADLGAGGPGEGQVPQDPVLGLIDVAKGFMELTKGKNDGDSVPVKALRPLVEGAAKLERELQDQGFQQESGAA